MRCAFAVRFTPTGVGTTFVIRSLNSSGTVHPHGRGDHSLVCRTPDRRPGSPPRAWGPPGLHAVQNGGVRFTPTGVGTTAIIAKFDDVYSVHPHGRGDHSAARRRGCSRSGSPPRAWGPLTDSFLFPVPRRFTPTGVGTTAKSPNVTPMGSVHPHGRGDHAVGRSRHKDRIGSPPRAWGPHRTGVKEADIARFTPTGVGTTGG